MAKPENPRLWEYDREVGGVPVATVTLRDLFAAFALAGMGLPADYSHGTHNAEAASRCYALADAMLAERERGEGGEDDGV